MKRTLLLLITLLFLSVTAFAQAGNAMIAKPEEQALMKPLIEAQTKAQDALNAKVATLPEAKTLNAAKEAYDKALAALQKAADNLPESTAWKEAGAKVADEAYRILADHKLSSREYKPELDPKGELVFVKTPPLKP